MLKIPISPNLINNLNQEFHEYCLAKNIGHQRFEVMQELYNNWLKDVHCTKIVKTGYSLRRTWPRQQYFEFADANQAILFKLRYA